MTAFYQSLLFIDHSKIDRSEPLATSMCEINFEPIACKLILCLMCFGQPFNPKIILKSIDWSSELILPVFVRLLSTVKQGDDMFRSIH